jgi:peptidoglycan hydrolase-like protein with peptidoglycan-binding domain
MPAFARGLPEVPFGSRTLMLQSPALIGTDVKVLQRIFDTMLELMRPPHGPLGAPIAVDGVYGPRTARAVAQVQAYFGLPETGVADAATFAHFGQVADAFGGPALGSRTLSPGTSGGDVLVLQNRLNTYRYARLLARPADGEYDAATQGAVSAFAADNVVFRKWQIRFDGTADAAVLDILWISTFAGGRPLAEGTHGFDTAFLQLFLENAGFAPGPIDGYFGRSTRRALQAFQAANGLAPSGHAGPETFWAIGLSNPAFWTSPRQRPYMTVARLHDIEVVTSTVDPDNGDRNPYGVVIAPPTFAAASTVLQYEDILVSNINNAQDVMGAGTTVERVHQGALTRFFAGAAAPIALATSNLGATWIANFGAAPDGSQGNIQVITPDGTLFSGGLIQNPLFAGPWGQVFNFGPLYGLPATFFSTNVLSGTVDQISGFVPPNFATTAVIRQIGSSLGHRGTSIDNAVGPQGMVWSPLDDTLYVADGADDRIAAYANASTVGTDQGRGATIFQGPPLRQPTGLALNPENGHLLAVNQLDNALVEIDPVLRAVVARVILDATPVNPVTGAGSALFGLATTLDAGGNLVVYFVDNNTETLNRLFCRRA